MKWLPTRTADECIELVARQNAGEDLGLSPEFVRAWRNGKVESKPQLAVVPDPPAVVEPVVASPTVAPVEVAAPVASAPPIAV